MNAEERLEKVDGALDDYEKVAGLPFVGEDEVTVEARRLLCASPAQLRKMTATETGEAAYVLRQFALRLQMALNRERARALWVDNALRRPGSKDEAPDLHTLKSKALLRAERISFLSGKVGDLAKAAEALQFSKRGEQRDV